MGTNLKRLLLLLFAVTSLHAQTREEITVEIVNVPVYIYQGTKPIDNLTRDNFELLLNGQPQPIDYFDVMDLGQPVARPGAPASFAEQRRLFLLLFDMAFSSPERIHRAQRAAAALVKNSAPADAFAVATFTATHGLDILLQFTSDKEAILGTVETLRPKTVEIAARESTMDSHEPPIVAFLDPTGLSFAEAGSPPEIAQELSKEPIRRLTELGIESLGDLASALRKIEGFNKHVILLSEGFRGGTDGWLVPIIDKMYQTFQGANAFLHALDTAGLRPSQSARMVETGDGLRQLSMGTGGQWLHNSNDLAGALTSLSDTYRRAYLLGFRAKGARDGYNSITVRVKNLPRGARIFYRRGFMAGAPTAVGLDSAAAAPRPPSRP
jgi:VWFA-related protein